jgi:hypothetical protein
VIPDEGGGGAVDGRFDARAVAVVDEGGDGGAALFAKGK